MVALYDLDIAGVTLPLCVEGDHVTVLCGQVLDGLLVFEAVPFAVGFGVPADEMIVCPLIAVLCQLLCHIIGMRARCRGTAGCLIAIIIDGVGDRLPLCIECQLITGTGTVIQIPCLVHVTASILFRIPSEEFIPGLLRCDLIHVKVVAAGFDSVWVIGLAARCGHSEFVCHDVTAY